MNTHPSPEAMTRYTAFLVLMPYASEMRAGERASDGIIDGARAQVSYANEGVVLLLLTGTDDRGQRLRINIEINLPMTSVFYRGGFVDGTYEHNIEAEASEFVASLMRKQLVLVVER